MGSEWKWFTTEDTASTEKSLRTKIDFVSPRPDHRERSAPNAARLKGCVCLHTASSPRREPRGSAPRVLMRVSPVSGGTSLLSSPYKVRVRQPYPRGGRLILSSTLGLLSGAAYFGVLMGAFALVRPANPFWFAIVAQLVPLVILPGLIAWWVSATCVKKRDAMFAGLLIGALFVVGVFICMLYTISPMQTVLDRGWMLLLYVASWAVGLGAAAGVFALAARWLNNLLFGALIEQNGSLCEVCAYDVSHSESNVCPECGTSIEQTTRKTRFGRRLAGWIQQRWRVVTCIGIMLIIGATAPLVWEVWPYVQFQKRFPNAEYDIFSFSVNEDGYVTIVEPAEERSKTSIVYEFGRQSRFGAPTMRISLGAKPNNPLIQRVDEGPVHIYADLVPSQTRYVLEHGLPEGLIEALHRQADELGWPESNSGTGNFHRVRAGRFFPDDLYE